MFQLCFYFCIIKYSERTNRVNYQLTFIKRGDVMIETNNYNINEEESDVRHICYNLNSSIKVFNYLTNNGVFDGVYIYVNRNIELKFIASDLDNYIEWFKNCETILEPYYESIHGDKVYDRWFDDIEVYRVDITFNNKDDYGATIYCGDRIYIDHTLEIYFDRKEVSEVILNG